MSRGDHIHQQVHGCALRIGLMDRFCFGLANCSLRRTFVGSLHGTSYCCLPCFSKTFCFMPKAHVVDHIVEQMITDSQSSPWTLNPLAHAVQVDEDFVGKCCCVARCVGVGQSIARVLQRPLMASNKHFVENRYLRA